jgi:hypothetical protein
MDLYFDWEMTMDKKFAQCHMCDRRKIKIDVSSLTACALTWWENLCVSDKPQTWKDLKILMGEKFSQHDLEKHIPIVSSSMPNILQDNAQNKEDYTEENEVLIMSHEVLELSTNLAPTTSRNESKGNDFGVANTHGEYNFDAPDLSTINVDAEQPIMEHFSDLSLSQDNCLVVPFDKEELCDNSLIIPLAQLSNQHDASNLESTISATNKHIVTVGGIKEEMRLVSSLNTLGYIEFNDLCNLNNLKETLFMCNDLPLLFRNKFQAVGKYNYEVEDCTNANHALLSFSCSTSFILTKLD